MNDRWDTVVYSRCSYAVTTASECSYLRVLENVDNP